MASMGNHGSLGKGAEAAATCLSSACIKKHGAKMCRCGHDGEPLVLEGAEAAEQQPNSEQAHIRSIPGTRGQDGMLSWRTVVLKQHARSDALPLSTGLVQGSCGYTAPRVGFGASPFIVAAISVARQQLLTTA